jgi:hypothetical protein
MVTPVCYRHIVSQPQPRVHVSKGVCAQVGISVLVSMDLIPEGRFGYTTEEHAQRITCTATIIEMAVFSLLLSYLFSHRSMNHSDHAGISEAALAPSALAAPVHAAEGVDGHHSSRSTTQASPAGGEGGVPVSSRPRGALFEQVMGDKVGHRKSSTEAISLMSVCCAPHSLKCQWIL